MFRVALFFALLFAVLFLWRALRHFADLLFGPSSRAREEEPQIPEQEMVRDPVCGAWIDRRLAIASSAGGEPVAVCSDGCRRELESRKPAP